jgi:hypothetical protein
VPGDVAGLAPRAGEGPWAHADAVRLRQNVMIGRRCFDIGFWMLLEYVAIEKIAYER